MTERQRPGEAKPLSISGVRLKRILAQGLDTQVALADYLRCDQTTISKWLTVGATPTLAIAVALSERWEEITPQGWLEISHDPDAFCEPFATIRASQLARKAAEIEPGRYRTRKQGNGHAPIRGGKGGGRPR